MLATIFGFLGDSLSFAGALVLAVDAVLRERDFKAQKNLVNMIKVLKEIRLTRHGIELIDADSANLVFIRQSVRRSVWGTIILTIGFICLFVTRCLDTFAKHSCH
jgi:hypothetical protein